jgi:hypothetical protein
MRLLEFKFSVIYTVHIVDLKVNSMQNCNIYKQHDCLLVIVFIWYILGAFRERRLAIIFSASCCSLKALQQMGCS